MDAEGFREWLGRTHLAPNTKHNALSLCREIEPLLEPLFGNLEEVVCDKTKMDDALSWLQDHAEEYVLKGKQKQAGADSRRWALRKYKAFFRSQKSMSAKAGS
jgi:hypothetical protein